MATRRRRHASDRSDRHRRRRQVLGDRRTVESLPRQLPGHAHRRDLGRSDPAPYRRRLAGRSHPHEFAAFEARVHAFDGDPPPARRDQCRAEGLHRLPARPGLRPGHGRDRRHRPVRFGDRRSGRFPGLRDDQRLRRAEPARKDRHARLRRTRGAEQVRQARRRRRAARRAQAVEAQPHRVQDGGRGRAGLSDHRQPVQRPRHQLDVREPVPVAARQAAIAGIALDAGHRHHAARTARDRADPGPAHPLSGRNRGTGPRHQSRRRIAGRDREPGAELLRHAARSRRSGAAEGAGSLCRD
jgi:hypothetical protein